MDSSTEEARGSLVVSKTVPTSSANGSSINLLSANQDFASVIEALVQQVANLNKWMDFFHQPPAISPNQGEVGRKDLASFPSRIVNQGDFSETPQEGSTIPLNQADTANITGMTFSNFRQQNMRDLHFPSMDLQQAA